MTDAAHHHAEGGGRLSLALAGVDDQKTFFDGLAGQDLVSSSLFLAHLLGMTSIDSGRFGGRFIFISRHHVLSSGEARNLIIGRVRARRPEAARYRLGKTLGDLAKC